MIRIAFTTGFRVKECRRPNDSCCMLSEVEGTGRIKLKIAVGEFCKCVFFLSAICAVFMISRSLKYICSHIPLQFAVLKELRLSRSSSSIPCNIAILSCLSAQFVWVCVRIYCIQYIYIYCIQYIYTVYSIYIYAHTLYVYLYVYIYIHMCVCVTYGKSVQLCSRTLTRFTALVLKCFCEDILGYQMEFVDTD